MDIFTEQIRERIEGEISKAEGNELFFVATMSEDGVVGDVRVVARGNEYSVPSIIDSAKHGDVVIHNHPSGNLTPSDPDIAMAAIFGNRGVGFFIIDNDATHRYVVVEPFAQRTLIPLDEKEISDLLGPKGKISSQMGDSYELREEQLEMAEIVSRAFNENTISLVEAGTGTGKTFAYLIPSALWAIRNGERVVISTNTINLQEQLVEKDIPLLKKGLIGADFKYSLVKGMGNYICMLRVDAVKDGQSELFEDEEKETLRDLYDWSKATVDGSLSDLNYTPPNDVWEKVRAESESCLRVRCPHYNDCFFYKARREMASAEILIANHHLVFSDLSIKKSTDTGEYGILPPYRRVIFDEAQHIEDSATSHFGTSVTKFGLIRLLRKLKRKGRRGDLKGLIYHILSLSAKLESVMRKGILNAFIETTNEIVSPSVDKAEESVREAFDELFRFGSQSQNQSGNGSSGSEFKLRVTDKLIDSGNWDKMENAFNDLRRRLVELEGGLKTLCDLLSEYESENEVAKALVEFKGIYNKVRFMAQAVASFFSGDEDGNVRWIEGRMRGDTIISGFGLSPLNVSEVLEERLYSGCDTVVMTSATMTVNKDFGFFKSRLGLEENERTTESSLPSPFDFQKQALLTVPRDVPEPNDRQFTKAISPMILEALNVTHGNALILFTSYGMLGKVFDDLSESLDTLGILSLKQGALPRGRLLDEFKQNKNSVLFATDSFWEGVDVPGEKLKLVIITRLPFRVPTEPVIEARVEHLESEGINSFLEYTIPQAVLKFKQGFGRLIRSRSDRGAVLVFDKRISTKRYGRLFIESLPDCNVFVDVWENVLDNLNNFFSNKD